MLRKGQAALRGAYDYATAPNQTETQKLAVITAAATGWALWELAKDGLNLEVLAPATVILLSGGGLVRKEGAANLVVKALETGSSLYNSGLTFYNNFKAKPAAPNEEVTETITKRNN